MNEMNDAEKGYMIGRNAGMDIGRWKGAAEGAKRVAIKVFIATVVALCIAIALNLAVFLCLAKAGHAHAHEYEISGINTRTGERVAGTMEDRDHNGTVTGMILDRLDRVKVDGRWSGKGMARMSDGITNYHVEVVE